MGDAVIFPVNHAEFQAFIAILLKTHSHKYFFQYLVRITNEATIFIKVRVLRSLEVRMKKVSLKE